jgi:hypothetical protein
VTQVPGGSANQQRTVNAAGRPERNSLRRLVERAGQTWRELSPARRLFWAGALWVVATLPVLSRLAIGRAAGDLTVFLDGAEAVLRGPLVYRDVVFEYPPYALLWFLPPRVLSHDLDSFRVAFGLEMWGADAAVKALLLAIGVRARTGLRDLAPFVAYSLGSAALGHVLLQRFDLIPSLLTLGATLAVAGGGVFAGGLLLAVGAGTKLYPALAFPMLAVFAWRRGPGALVRFVAGAALASLPLLAAAVWVPWWRFASYHVGRGLQVESSLASVVWALHFAGVPAGWELRWRTHEVTGPLAAALVGPGQLLFLLVTLAAVVAATSTAWRLGALASRRVPIADMAVVLLLPIAAFVAANTVLSPQFHLWLLPLAALVLFAPAEAATAPESAATVPAEARRAAWCILAATLIVPAFYPHREFATGLGPLRTAILLLRNGLLIYATASLWVAVGKMGRSDCPSVSPARRADDMVIGAAPSR